MSMYFKYYLQYKNLGQSTEEIYSTLFLTFTISLLLKVLKEAKNNKDKCQVDAEHVLQYLSLQKTFY